MSRESVDGVRHKISEVLNKNINKIQVGWSPPTVDRKEGEFWTDHDGKQWTKKGGLIQSISKLDKFKTPWWCPVCGTPLNGHHLTTYKKRGTCYECVIAEEMKLKQTGLWKSTLMENGRQNLISEVKDKIEELQDYKENVSHPEFIHADNEKILMIEKWNTDITTVKEQLTIEINRLQEILKKLENGVIDEDNN